MFDLAFLVLLSATSPEAPVLKAELKEVPSAGTSAPAITASGTTNLPDGATLSAYLYYGVVDEGRAVATGVATVNQGRFSEDLIPFPRSTKNLPGKYIVRLSYNPGLQNLAITGFDPATVDVSLALGTPEDFERDARLIRARLADEIRTFVAMGEELKAKMKELKGRPPADWSPILKDWLQKTAEIQGRAQSENVREYRVLRLDLIADSGLETLSGILNSAAKYAAAGKTDDALEGLARLHQTAETWIAEIASPKLSSPAEFRDLIESAQKLVSEAFQHPEAPVLPARRRFVEMNALLQRSLPDDFQKTVLDIGDRSTAFFNALADRDPRAKDLRVELDRLLEKLAVHFRMPK